MMLSTMAIVVVAPPPPPPATATQQQCKYSVRIDSDTYQCYTEEEWQQKQAADAAVRAQDDADFNKFWTSTVPSFLIANWWKIILWILGALITFVLLLGLSEWVERKRHPERYRNGIYIGDPYDYWKY